MRAPFKEKKPKVGDKVWLVAPKSRNTDPQKPPTEHEVIKVGSKYFQVKGSYNNIVHLDLLTGQEKGDLNYKIYAYPTLEEILIEWEREELMSKIREQFHWQNTNKFTIEQLRKINEIISQ